MKVTTETRTASEYARIFEEERKQEYPSIDAFEKEMGYAIPRGDLENAAWVLACPLKKNPPHWQHGRVLYAAARKYLETAGSWPRFLDIGTAKGFSALCVLWALQDSGKEGHVLSVDVRDPRSTERRNSVAECDGPKTLAEILKPWPEIEGIVFLKSTGVEVLARMPSRVNFAFVDGKHSGDVVSQEAALLAKRQEPGDVAIFDDAHMPDVRAAIETARVNYELTYLAAKPGREYAIARRK